MNDEKDTPITNDVKKDFLENLTAEVDLSKKEKELRANKINVQYDRLKENEQKTKAVEQSKYGTISQERAEELAVESDNYLIGAKKQMAFINDSFNGMVSFFEQNLILIGAKTGAGKSTCVANLAMSLITQKNPFTGKGGRCLVITNEESIIHLYNRVTCLIKGWHYSEHDQFTEEQRKTFSSFIPTLSQRITVVDDTFASPSGGTTTSVEGIENIFKNIVRDNEQYDAVIIDYYQGVIDSTKDSLLTEYQVQRRLTHVLEKYRKIYKAPIVIMAQVTPPTDEDDHTPFQVRLQGTKLICNKATVIIEMLLDGQNLRTEWVFRKGRYSSFGSESVETGYSNGRFVKYDDAFKNNLKRRRELAEAAELNKKTGIKLGKEEEEVPSEATGT